MNRLLTFLFVFLITVFASGQNERVSAPIQNVFPSFNEHPEWIVQRSIEPSLPGPVYVMSYHLEKDTIIDQKTYSPVSRTGNQQPLLAYEHVGFVRIDGKKVFFKKSAEGKEYLLYDFGLKVGEKVYCPYYELDSAQYHVLSIDSVELNGIKRLQLKVRPEDYYIDGPFEMYWIEGIGNLENPFYADVFARSGFSDIVRCISTDAGPLYTNPDYDDCATVLKNTDCVVNEGFVWSGMEIYKDLTGKDSVASYHIKFEGDTLLNDRTYTKIWQSNDSLGINWDLTGLIREVENRVYYHNLYDDSWNDLLLYDFSVQTGKSMLLSSVGSPGQFENMKVTSVDSVEINGTKRLRIQLSDGTGSDIWIEKIGSLQGIINRCYFEPVKIDRILLCVSENGNTIYTNEEYPECFYTQSNFTNNKQFTTHGLIKIYPNPFNDLITIDYQGSEAAVLEILSAHGKLVFKMELNNSGSSRVNFPSLPAGLYLVKLKTGNKTLTEKILKN
ncbi:MAG: T9SS type A sorting domain-containing protein [Draconibacterium sp.]